MTGALITIFWVGLGLIRATYWLVYASFYLIFFIIVVPWVALYEIGLIVEKSQNEATLTTPDSRLPLRGGKKRASDYPIR